jgi:HTH-type transcriptional regulator / antitoxin HipB
MLAPLASSGHADGGSSSLFALKRLLRGIGWCGIGALTRHERVKGNGLWESERSVRRRAIVDVNIDVRLIDFDIDVVHHDFDMGVGGTMAYTGKVTSAESLGRILQQARLLSGLSQRELASRLGTTQKYIWELEAGKPSILMDRLFAAMRETGMELTATIKPREDKRG